MAAMKSCAAILFIWGVFYTMPSCAAEQSQAREVARLNNCPVKKIEVYQNSLGTTGETIYRVQCTMPKTTDQTGKEASDTLLIGCDSGICELIRPTVVDKK